jgi:hypothetical protein
MKLIFLLVNSCTLIATRMDAIALMLVRPETLTPLLERMQQHYPLYLVPALIIGLYLTCAGFAARSERS